MSHIGCTSYTWKQKKNKKGKRGSQTPGRDKPTCSATNAMRNAARRNRAYKLRNYQSVVRAWIKNNK